MKRHHLFRAVTLFLALVHTFPARRHLAEFFAEPSWNEAWKGFGALLAIIFYLFPPLVQIRALRALFRERRALLRIGGVVLAVAHLVPAFDHIPRFVAEPSFADAWRGFGSALAALWFLTPLPWQLRVVIRVQIFLSRLLPQARATAIAPASLSQ